MVNQMTPYKKGSKFYIKMYGIEYELIMPVEESPESKKIEIKGKKAKAEKKIKE